MKKLNKDERVERNITWLFNATMVGLIVVLLLAVIEYAFPGMYDKKDVEWIGYVVLVLAVVCSIVLVTNAWIRVKRIRKELNKNKSDE